MESCFAHKLNTITEMPFKYAVKESNEIHVKSFIISDYDLMQ